MHEIFDWNDEKTWPLSFFGKSYLDEDRPHPRKVKQFLSTYSHVKAYHACRPSNISDYYKNGIYPRSYEELLNDFMAFIEETIKITVPLEKVEMVRKKIGTFHDKRVFLALDKNTLIEEAGHYAIYGSEFIHAMAVHLGENGVPITREHLKRRGTPTIFTVVFPIDKSSDDDVNSLVTKINNAIYEKSISTRVDFTFEFFTAIDADSIVAHEHPKRIRDQHNSCWYYADTVV